MNIGEPNRELDVEPLLYPAALPAEATPALPPAAVPAEAPWRAHLRVPLRYLRRDPGGPR